MDPTVTSRIIVSEPCESEAILSQAKKVDLSILSAWRNLNQDRLEMNSVGFFLSVKPGRTSIYCELFIAILKGPVFDVRVRWFSCPSVLNSYKQKTGFFVQGP